MEPRILFLTLEKRSIGCKMTSPDGDIYWDINNILHALDSGDYDEVRIVLTPTGESNVEDQKQTQIYIC